MIGLGLRGVNITGQRSLLARAISAIRRLGGTALYVPDDYGLVLGPELVTNGDFSAGLTGWTSTGGTIAVVGGELEITGAASSFPKATQVVSTVVGRTYKLSGTARRGTSINSAVLRAGVANVAVNNTTTADVYGSVTFQATGTSITVECFNNNNPNTGTNYFDNISVREIISATTYIDSTGTQPVTAINDLVGLLTDRSYGAGNLGGELASASSVTLTGTSAFVALTMTTPPAIGKSYRVTYTYNVSSGAVQFGSGASFVNGPVHMGPTSGSYSYVAAGTGTSTDWIAYSNAAFGSISGISIREVLGSHATQPTTASKPLVTQLANGTKALDFDGSNDLLTLSSGAILQQGSDHFVTAAFVLDAVGATQTIYATSSTTAVNPLIATFDITTLGKLVGYWRDNAGASKTCTSTTTLVAGVPYVATIAKVGINYTLWINGVVEATVAGAALGTTTVDTANIGTQNYGGALNNRLNGKIIDIVIDQGTLTEADRKTIERNMAQRAGVTYAG